MQANMASCQISEDVLGLFAGPKPQARLGNTSDRRRKRPIKHSSSEDGHGRAIESLDLQAPSTQRRRTRKKTLSPFLLPIWWRRVRHSKRADYRMGQARQSNESEREAGLLPRGPRAWKAGMHGGLAGSSVAGWRW